MIGFITFICFLPILFFWSYKLATKFNDRFVCVKNVYVVSNNNCHKLIIYCYDSKKYVMTYYNSSMCVVARNIKIGDNIVLSGYGIDSSILGMNYVISHIEFK